MPKYADSSGRNAAATRSNVSPKVGAATLGGALATIIWIALCACVPGLQERLGEAGLTALTGATGTVLTFALGYGVPDPLRGGSAEN